MVLGCEVSSFDVDGFVAFIVFNKFVGSFDP